MENCNHSILSTTRNPWLFYSSHFSQVNPVGIISQPLYVPKAGIRGTGNSTEATPSLKQIRFQQRGNQWTIMLLICSWHAHSGFIDNIASAFHGSLHASAVVAQCSVFVLGMLIPCSLPPLLRRNDTLRSHHCSHIILTPVPCASSLRSSAPWLDCPFPVL